MLINILGITFMKSYNLHVYANTNIRTTIFFNIYLFDIYKHKNIQNIKEYEKPFTCSIHNK